MEAVALVGRELRLDPELQPIVEAVLELVDGILAVADREIVLELQLMALNDRAANLEIAGFGPNGASGDQGRREDRTADAIDDVLDANAAHLQLLPKIREGRAASSPLFAGLELGIGRATDLRPGGRRGAADQPHQAADDEQRRQVEHQLDTGRLRRVADQRMQDPPGE